MGFAKEEALHLLHQIRHTQRLLKNVQSFKYA